jgi:molybdopterin/thiamine biosynthesis adenylyltransferase
MTTPPTPSTPATGRDDGRRYLRNRESITEDQQAVLKRARVTVVGLGGLGGATVEVLARIGVGTLTLVDGDRFETTNLNRQLLCTEQTLGGLKAAAAADRVSQINPTVTIHSIARRLTPDNAIEILGDSHLVMDCLDNLPTRFMVQGAARRLGIPMVSAAVAGNAGQLTLIEPEDPGLEAVYGPAEAAPEHGAETRLGVLPHTVIALACLACSEAVKRLLGTGTGLRRKLLLVDLLDNRFDIVEI